MVQDFLYADGPEGAEGMFNAFAELHYKKFENSEAEEVENNLEWSAIHEEFSEKFEARLETYFKECGCSVDEFY